MYQKEIIYMGLYKDGSRIGNAGFLKVENREKESSFDLKLRNIPYNIRGRFPVRIHNGNDWKEINGVSVQEGNGSWRENLAENLERMQIQIMLPGGYFLEGKSKNAPETVSWTKTYGKGNTEAAEGRIKKEESDDEKKNQEKASGSTQVKREAPEPETSDLPANTASDIYKDGPENSSQNPSQSIVEDTEENRDVRPKEKIQNNQKEKRQTIIVTEELQRTNLMARPSGFDSTADSSTAYSLKEDKWEQILDNYEKIHPYDDERVYVKLEPKDFIILQAKYQHLVNNSFLLHGFYNYRYVILGKEQDYYLGVPGVYYEREKMVALMFGFEAFECPGGIAKAGEFGYYLRKVEL